MNTKKYMNLSNNQLMKINGGRRHRHSYSYDAGYYLAKALGIAGAASLIYGLVGSQRN